MVVLDAIALVELNRTILYSQVERGLDALETNPSQTNARPEPISFMPHCSLRSLFEKEVILQMAVNILITHRIKINSQSDDAVLFTQKVFDKALTDLGNNYNRWVKERGQNILNSTQLVAEVCFISIFTHLTNFYLRY